MARIHSSRFELRSPRSHTAGAIGQDLRYELYRCAPATVSPVLLPAMPSVPILALLLSGFWIIRFYRFCAAFSIKHEECRVTDISERLKASHHHRPGIAWTSLSVESPLGLFSLVLEP